MMSGAVIWITGLSGAGKSTLASRVCEKLRDMSKAVVLLDGDELRAVFGAEGVSHHGREARLGLALQYARLCRLLAEQGLVVVIATISLFREVHAWNRANLPGYFEIYLKVPLAELRRRDPKGIYRRYDAGEIADVAGLDLDVDEPYAANLVVENASVDLDEQIITAVRKLTEGK
jgi:adenylylsulfate kinase-like enzyme